MKRGDWILTGTLVVLAGILVWVVAGTLEPPVVNAGDTAPKFSVVTEDGKTIYEGKGGDGKDFYAYLDPRVRLA